MKFVALISGGKDSFFNIHHCLSQGHELIALANLFPQEIDELDSFMFQTVGHEVIDHYQQCLNVPLYRREIKQGGSKNTQLEYSQTDNDEIEDLFLLLQSIKLENPDLQAVSCGAILSHYQRTRVENVCDRLGLTSLAYLWQRDQLQLMQEICNSNLDARLIKVAAIGLNETNLGKSLKTSFQTLQKLNQLYQVHICGEGGEFETIVFDANFFIKKIALVDSKIFSGSNDVSYLKIINSKVVDKEQEEFQKLTPPPLLDPDFEEIYQNVEKIDVVEEISNTNDPVVMKSIIVSTKSKYYISNLTSDCESIESQLEDLFDQLQAILISKNVSLNNVQSITLLVKDMNNFSKINRVYSQAFASYYLPPSRICIATNIFKDIQLSCIVLQPSEQVSSTKYGIHIRSRSYWAPHNIGPYSQSIVDQNEKYRIASISGQIPLIPSTMEFMDNGPMFDSILALQHFHKVKQLIGVNQIESIICFITSNSIVKTVTNVWNRYEDSNNLLIIVKVKALPRNACIEWGGYTYEPIVDMYDDSDNDEESKQGLLDNFNSIINSFDYKSMNEVSNSMKCVTLFTNEVDKVNKTIDINNSINFLQVFASPMNCKKLNNQNFDYLPVESIHNKEGTSFEFAIIWKIEG